MNDRSRWAVARILAPAAGNARTAGRLGGDVWLRWLGTLAAGYALTWGVIVLVMRTGERLVTEGGLAAADERWLRAFSEVSWFTYADGLWFEAWGSSAFLIPMVLVAAAMLLHRGHLLEALTLVLAYLSIKTIVFGAWQLWDRPRPELIADGIASPGLHSFPSGHAVNSIVLFGLLGAAWWRRSASAVERALAVFVVAAVSLLTCAGRVRIGTHWPSDIAAGFVIGGAWLCALVTAQVVAERRIRERRGAAADDRA